MKNNEQNLSSKEQFFFFISNKDMYAFKALSVLEIVEYPHITHVPLMSDYVKGVTNIRGNIITVIDLLQRCGLKQNNETTKRSLVIIKKKHAEKEIHIGVIIDKVFEIDEIGSENIEAVPEFGTKIDKHFILNMVMYNDEYIPVLNIDTLLDIDILSTLSTKKG